MEELAERLKVERNRVAEELALDRGVLMPNAMVLEIARVSPSSQTELQAVQGVRAWQAELLGDALLTVLR